MDQPAEQEQTDHTEKPLPPKLTGHAEELVDHYWGSINYIFGLIRASEIKAGLILSFYGIVLNLVYSHIDEVFERAMDYPVLYVLTGLWFITTVISIYFSIRCFMPRMEMKFEKNVFFFMDVINNYGTVKEFSRTFYKISLNQDELFDQLGQQIYVNSKIAAVKFKNVNRSLLYLALGLILLFITSLVYITLAFKS